MAAPLGEPTAARLPGLPLRRIPAGQLRSSRVSAAGLPPAGLSATCLPAAGLRVAAPLPPAALLPAAAQVRRPAATGTRTVGAGNHPAASAEPQRHLQRCGGLHTG